MNYKCPAISKIVFGMMHYIPESLKHYVSVECTYATKYEEAKQSHENKNGQNKCPHPSRIVAVLFPHDEW